MFLFGYVLSEYLVYNVVDFWDLAPDCVQCSPISIPPKDKTTEIRVLFADPQMPNYGFGYRD